MSDASFIQVAVDEIVDAAPSIVSIRLRRSGGGSMPPFEPGSHIEVAIPNGVKRQYSICSNPADLAAYTIAVRREERSRGGSDYLCSSLDIGDIMLASLPRSTFALDASAKHHVFIAGGIGITPFVPMLHALADAGTSCELHYASKSREDAVFLDAIRAMAGPRVTAYHSAEGTRLPLRELLNGLDLDAQIYCCGPDRLMNELRALTLANGHRRPRFEAFTGVEVPPIKAGDRFDVLIKSTGAIVSITAQETMLEGLRRAGHDVPSSCEHGHCGTCILHYTEGQAVHRDGVLNAEQRQSYIATCISRGKGSLTLDI
jgi:tetrachlorobenzoquinone reductase